MAQCIGGDDFPVGFPAGKNLLESIFGGNFTARRVLPETVGFTGRKPVFVPIRLTNAEKNGTLIEEFCVENLAFLTDIHSYLKERELCLT